MTLITPTKIRAFQCNKSSPTARSYLLQHKLHLGRTVIVRSQQQEDADLNQQLLDDLKRIQERSGTPQTPSSQQSAAEKNFSASSSSQQSSSPLDGVKDTVDKILIADFFFVLFALAFLGVALAERSAFNSTTLLDTWLNLWQWVFQPAIGVLMLGALVSGGVGWAKENMK